MKKLLLLSLLSFALYSCKDTAKHSYKYKIYIRNYGAYHTDSYYIDSNKCVIFNSERSNIMASMPYIIIGYKSSLSFL